MAITGQGFSSRFSLPFFSTVDGGFFRAPPCNFTHGLHQDIQHVPSGYVKIAIENAPFRVSFSIKNGDCP